MFEGEGDVMVGSSGEMCCSGLAYSVEACRRGWKSEYVDWRRVGRARVNGDPIDRMGSAARKIRLGPMLKQLPIAVP